jgi:hypothetical protein
VSILSKKFGGASAGKRVRIIPAAIEQAPEAQTTKATKARQLINTPAGLGLTVDIKGDYFLFSE